MSMNMSESKPVGLTADSGFQIGVRRTLPIPQQQAWELLTSPQGLKLWLGDIDGVELQAGSPFVTRDGTSGELRVVKEPAQLRLTWQPAGWAKPSTLQIRVLEAKGDRTTISFHQEKLDDGETREAMKARWEGVIARIAELA